MFNRRKPAAAAVMLMAAIGPGGGCQSYHPRPLDPAAHAELWRARNIADPTVRMFVEELEAAGGALEHGGVDPGLSLAEAELVALVFNADLRMARLRAGIARATAENAGLWQDPVFQIDVLRVVESVPNPWVISPGLVFTIPLSGRLAAERARASSALRAELVRIAEAEWLVRRELREAWAEWSAAQLRIGETRRLIETLNALVETTAILAGAGELERTEASLFAIERAQRLQDVRRFDADVALLELRIKRLMGLAPGASVELVPSSFATAAIEEELHDVHGPAARSLTLVRLREEYQVAEEVLQREIARQYPDLAIGPIFQSDQGQSQIGVLGGIPIPVLNRNRQAIAEAQAQREFARGMYEVEYEHIVSELASLAAHIEALREQRREVEAVIVPLVDRQLADARRLLEMGEAEASGGLVLLESLRRGHEVKLSLIQMRMDEAIAEIQWNYLAGPPDSQASPLLLGAVQEVLE